MWEDITQFITDHPWLAKTVASLAIIGVAVVLRWALRRSIRVMEIPSIDLRRRWVLSIRALTLGLITLGLGMIWATELQTMAISIVAVLVAVVLSLKEIIACVTGSFLKIGGRSFTMGDRIRVGELCGDVIDQTLLTTTVMEVGPGTATSQYTGRSVVIPNSLYLTAPVARESALGNYALTTLIIPLNITDDIAAAKDLLLSEARAAVEPFITHARAAAQRIERTEGIEPPSVEPRVTITMVDPSRCDLLVRFPAPINGRREIEQAILARYLEHRRQQTAASTDSSNPPTA